jgi:protein-disulfide isomerase
MRRIVVSVLLLLLVLTVTGVSQADPAGGEPMSEDAFVRMLEKVLRDNPDIVLEVLRRNSESVLDIAQQGSVSRRRRTLETQWRNDVKVPKRVRAEGHPTLGSANAKVRIVAFTDFTCHFCQQASQVVDVILKDYGSNVGLVFKSMALDEKGIGALSAAYFLAAAQQHEEKAWNLYHRLFASRDRLIGEGEEFLRKAAAEIGLDVKRLQRDVKGKRVAEILAEDQQDAHRLGVEGTPFFLVNNLVVKGALPLDLFKLAVDMAMKTGR